MIQGEDTQPVLQIQGSTFRGLKAQRGSAIYSKISYMDLRIDGSSFENNEALVEGGAIYLNSGKNIFFKFRKNNLLKGSGTAV